MCLNTHLGAVRVVAIGTHVLLGNRLLVLFRLIRFLLLLIHRELQHDVLTRFTLPTFHLVSVMLVLLRLFPI
jgi:hypothetical protein